MDAPTTPLRRPHRIVVNVDAATLERLDAIAALARESRSAVAADVLGMFMPMFEPVAQAVAEARERPAKAVKLLREQAASMQVLAADLVERARSLPSELDRGRPGTDAEAAAPVRPGRRGKPASKPPGQ